MYSMVMGIDDTHTDPATVLARELIESHGCDQAAVEAAHNARECVNKGDPAACQKWLTVLQRIRTWYDAPRDGFAA